MQRNMAANAERRICIRIVVFWRSTNDVVTCFGSDSGADLIEHHGGIYECSFRAAFGPPATYYRRVAAANITRKL
jgi:hypothetical protein